MQIINDVLCRIHSMRRSCTVHISISHSYIFVQVSIATKQHWQGGDRQQRSVYQGRIHQIRVYHGRIYHQWFTQCRKQLFIRHKVLPPLSLGKGVVFISLLCLKSASLLCLMMMCMQLCMLWSTISSSMQNVDHIIDVTNTGKTFPSDTFIRQKIIGATSQARGSVTGVELLLEKSCYAASRECSVSATWLPRVCGSHPPQCESTVREAPPREQQYVDPAPSQSRDLFQPNNKGKLVFVHKVMQWEKAKNHWKGTQKAPV